MDNDTKVTPATAAAPVLGIASMTDRELMEYIATNMITADKIIAEIQRYMPTMLEQLEQLSSNPLVGTIIRFLPKPKD